MTALNFAITDEGIFLATDTLVSRDGRPLMFTAKVLTLPHMHGLVSGTGSMVLFQRWSLKIVSEILAAHMHVLDLCTPSRLRKIWAEMSDEERGGGPADIYHLCYDPDDDQFGGFAYRSSNDFESEPLGHGTYPEPGLGGAFPITAFPGDLVRACRRLRFEQDRLDLDKRQHIGGQVIAYMMQRHEADGQPMSTLTTVQTAYEFEDFEAAYGECDERTLFDGCK
ncbi:hypothetical protein [uncultured Sphingopyxis sp.]|uniref:hypothetical protein n=1 Tax=uncultured Sphingopyxis sp. TaxID=310581 RepID=UPI0025E01D65|nr:hypothetical protein [uncultured Sphingopyxis sp.]